MNNESHTYLKYESLVKEFKQNLKRELTLEEKNFLEWLSQMASDDIVQRD